MANLWSKIKKESMFADGARMFGLFPRDANPGVVPTEGEEEEVQVMETDGVEPLLTLRTIESVFFHHPKASVTFVRSSSKSDLGKLEAELETLQESGYNLRIVEEITTPGLDGWIIHSPTILLKPMPKENSSRLKQEISEEVSSENVMIVSNSKYISDLCKEENQDLLHNLTAIKINHSLNDIRDIKTETSLCHQILNNFCIFANIII